MFSYIPFDSSLFFSLGLSSTSSSLPYLNQLSNTQTLVLYDKMDPLHFIVLSFLVFGLCKVVLSMLSKRQLLAEAKRLGCKSPFLVPSRLPFGLDHLHRRLKAANEKRLPDMLVDLRAELGRTTYQYNMLGNEQLHTVEPKKIQAMLATQFSDFELGKVRREIMFPLLGNGIFTQDGEDWLVFSFQLGSLSHQTL